MYEQRPSELMPEYRRWPLGIRIGVAALAAALVALAFILPALYSAPGDVDESEWPSGELPAAGEAAANASDESGEDGEESPELPDGTALYDGEPLWTMDSEDESLSALPLEQGTLVKDDEGIRLEAEGQTVWEHPIEEFGPVVGVSDEVVIVSSSLGDFMDEDFDWPGREFTAALDLDTGEEIWSDDTASFVTAYSDAVLMTECTGDQKEHIGDCTLYARDPSDFSTRWSTPTYASAQAYSSPSWTGSPMPDPLLIASYPNGHEDRTISALDASGNELVSVQTDDSAFVSDDVLVVYDDYDDNPADECTASLAGYRFGEDGPAWEIEADTVKTADLIYCGDLPTTRAQDGMLPVTIDGEATLLDLGTGEVPWTAPEGDRALALSSDASVLVAANDAETDNLIAYDVESEQELWRATAELEASTTTSAVGSTLWFHGDPSIWGWSSYEVIGINFETGEAMALPGSAYAFRPGQIITSEGYDPTVFNAWPADLWE